MRKIKKICYYCKEPMLEDTFSSICRKCLQAKEIKKKIKFDCKPPYTCFYCPYPDCLCMSKSITDEEHIFLKNAGFHNSGRSKRKKKGE